MLTKANFKFMRAGTAFVLTRTYLPHPNSTHHIYSFPDKVTVDDGTCFESLSPLGISAIVSGEYFENVMIWDEDAPCPTGQVYVHFAGDYDGVFGANMTAGAGYKIHTYRAAIFDVLPVPQGVAGCYRADLNVANYCVTTWKVARYGTDCIPSL